MEQHDILNDQIEMLSQVELVEFVGIRTNIFGIWFNQA